jgi:hypothetical protein
LLRSVFGVLALAEWVLLRVCLPFGKGGVWEGVPGVAQLLSLNQNPGAGCYFICQTKYGIMSISSLTYSGCCNGTLMIQDLFSLSVLLGQCATSNGLRMVYHHPAVKTPNRRFMALYGLR